MTNFLQLLKCCSAFFILYLELVLSKDIPDLIDKPDDTALSTKINSQHHLLEKRSSAFKRLPGWSVYYGKRSSDSGHLDSKSRDSNTELINTDVILNNLLASSQSSRPLSSSSPGAGEFTVDSDSDEALLKSGGSYPPYLSPLLYSEEGERTDEDDSEDHDSFLEDYIEENEDQREQIQDDEAVELDETSGGGDIDKRYSGWNVAYGKRRPGWYAMYGKRSPQWLATYGKRAPQWLATYGKRAPQWLATYGKRAPQWLATYGKRAPQWLATYGKRAPQWVTTYGKRAPQWVATYGKRAPQWLATYGKRAPQWVTTYGKRGFKWQALYGKRDTVDKLADVGARVDGEPENEQVLSRL